MFSVMLRFQLVLLLFAVGGCTESKQSLSAPTMNQNAGGKENWVDIAMIGSADSEGQRLLSKVLDQAGIKHGFHGSRAYALSVQKQDAKRARALIQKSTTRIPTVTIIP